ncbi:MAG: hypothetical protein ABIK28_23760 [Planctomycetota bacterium]
MPCFSGGTIALSLNAGGAFASNTYIILSGLSGTWPGFSMSGIAIPLNVDDWTWNSFTLINSPMMAGFMGQLDAGGVAAATLKAPAFLPSSLVGLVIHFDYVVLAHPASPPVVRASHPVHLVFMP